MNISENKITFTNNNVKNASSFLIAYENKRVKLKMIKDTISMYQNSFLEKEKDLKEEQQKLEELNFQVSSIEDSYCEQVWQFSHEHNFSDIFKYYPFGIEIDCTKKIRNSNKDDVEESSQVIDLINEIDAIRAEIFSFNQNVENIKQEVENALMNLWKLQLIANDITELLRLISPSESYLCEPATISIPIYDEVLVSDSVNKIRRNISDSNHENLRSKKPRNNQKLSKGVKNKSCLKNDTSNFTPTKKVTIASFKNYPELFLEKSIVLTAKTPMTNVSAEESTCNEKLDNFTPKKRSEISIKFEQHRRHM